MAGSRSALVTQKQRARRNHGLEKGCHHNENEPQTQNSKKTPTAPFPIQISTLNVDRAYPGSRQAQPARPRAVLRTPDFKDSGPPRQKLSISVAAGLNPPEAAPGARGCREEEWATVGAASPPPPPPARGLFGGWRAPPPRAGSGARAPGPPRRLRPGAPAAVPETPAQGRHPISGPRACPLRRRRAWARAPGCLRPEKHLLCTEPGKLSPSLLAFMAADWGRGWSPAGRGARNAGRTRVYMVQGLFLLFSTTPPAFLLAPRGGRTDVQRARHFRCLRAPARPGRTNLASRLRSRGKEPGRPAPGPRSPGVRTAAHKRRSGRGQQGTRPQPRAAPAGALPHPGSWARRVWHPLPSPHPGSGAFAPALWASGPRRVRAIKVVPGFADEARARQQLGGCVGGWVLGWVGGGRVGLSLAGGECRLSASAERLGGPLPSSEIKRTVLTCLGGNWDLSLGARPLAPGVRQLFCASPPRRAC